MQTHPSSHSKFPAPAEVSLRQPWQSSKDLNNNQALLAHGMSRMNSHRQNGMYDWVKQQLLSFVRKEDKIREINKRKLNGT